MLQNENGVARTFVGIRELYRHHIFVIVNQDIRKVIEYSDANARSLFEPMIKFLENEFVINHNH